MELDPLNVPKMDDAVRFTECERFAQKKVLVHRQEKEIHRHKEMLDPGSRGPSAIKGLVDPAELPEYLASSWDLDRIYYYLIEENLEVASQSNLEKAIAFVSMEIETLRSRIQNPSMMPLHYSLGALCALIPNHNVGKELASRVEMVLQDVESYLEEPANVGDGDQKLERDKGRQVRRTIAEIRDKVVRSVRTNPMDDEERTNNPGISVGATS